MSKTPEPWSLWNPSTAAALMRIGFALAVIVAGAWWSLDGRLDGIEQTQAVQVEKQALSESRLERIEIKIDALRDPLPAHSSVTTAERGP